MIQRRACRLQTIATLLVMVAAAIVIIAMASMASATPLHAYDVTLAKSRTEASPTMAPSTSVSCAAACDTSTRIRLVSFAAAETTARVAGFGSLVSTYAKHDVRGCRRKWRCLGDPSEHTGCACWLWSGKCREWRNVSGHEHGQSRQRSDEIRCVSGLASTIDRPGTPIATVSSCRQREKRPKTTSVTPRERASQL